MAVKLTLSVEQGVIDRAKRYSRRHRKSLSKLVEGYLRELAGEPSGEEALTPKVRALSGVLPQGCTAAGEREGYAEYLGEKYR